MNITLNKLTFRYCSLPVGCTDAEGDREENPEESFWSAPLLILTSRKLNTCRGGLCVDGCVCWIGLRIWKWPPKCSLSLAFFIFLFFIIY